MKFFHEWCNWKLRYKERASKRILLLSRLSLQYALAMSSFDTQCQKCEKFVYILFFNLNFNSYILINFFLLILLFLNSHLMCIYSMLLQSSKRNETKSMNFFILYINLSFSDLGGKPNQADPAIITGTNLLNFSVRRIYLGDSQSYSRNFPIFVARMPSEMLDLILRCSRVESNFA